MTKKIPFCLFFVLLFLFTSCGMFFDTAAPDGNLILSLGQPTGRAGTGGIPTDDPAFSSVTVTVRQKEKVIVSQTFPGYRQTLALSVPKGRGYTVEVYGLVDHDKSDAIFGFCHSFAGLAEGVSIFEGKTNAVRISLEMKESWLIYNYPHGSLGNQLSLFSDSNDLYSANKFGFLAADYCFTFDKYGRLYFVKSDNPQVIVQSFPITATPTPQNLSSVSGTIIGLAYDSFYDLLLYREDPYDALEIGCFFLDKVLIPAGADMDSDGVTTGSNNESGPIAADGTGHFFIVNKDAYSAPSSSEVMKLKLMPDAGGLGEYEFAHAKNAEGAIIPSYPFAGDIKHIAVHDGKLIAIAVKTSENMSQIIGLDAASLEPLWEPLKQDGLPELEDFTFLHFAGNRGEKVFIAAFHTALGGVRTQYFIEIDINTGSFVKTISLP